LIFAGRMGNYELLQALIRKNVAFNSRDEDTGNTVFMEALYMKHFHFILKALEKYSDPRAFNAQNSFSEESLLHMAVKAGSFELVEALLVKEGIRPNLQDGHGKTILHLALEEPLHAMLALILSKAQGLDVNIADRKGRTPLITAVKKQNTEGLRIFLAHPGVAVNVQWKDELGKDACQYTANTQQRFILL